MMEEVSIHKSVLLEESIDLLKPSSKKVYLDGTFGGGGHTRAVLEASKTTKVVALDRDPNTEQFADRLNQEFSNRVEFHAMSFDQIETLGRHFDGAIIDLGMSSDQLETSGRGFSYGRNEPLDMRFNDGFGQTAAQFLMQSSAHEIERVFREYGEDRFAKRLAVRIISERRQRPIKTTGDFVSYVGTENPKVLAPLFQALRISVNHELEALSKGLPAIVRSLDKGAVLVVISFHSLEDRIVKTFFKENSELEILTKKPVAPGGDELISNPRSRSAKLRAARKQ